jgi:hypothetical protein
MAAKSRTSRSKPNESVPSREGANSHSERPEAFTRAGRSVSPSRHSDTTASTPSGSDRGADAAEPDTVVVGIPDGYTQFVTAVKQAKWLCDSQNLGV